MRKKGISCDKKITKIGDFFNENHLFYLIIVQCNYHYLTLKNIIFFLQTLFDYVDKF